MDDNETIEPGEGGAAGAATGLAAAALSLAGRRGGKAGDRLDVFLERQSGLTEAQRELTRLQIANLEEDRALQHRHLALRFFRDRLRIALELIAVAFGVAIVAALAVMVWQARADHSLVVASFFAPPDLAARGATGQALAEDLMSRMGAIRSVANRNSLTTTEEVRSDQAESVKVEIPQTGVSLGELSRFLHRWLGQETVVTGQARDEAGGQVSILLDVAGSDPIEVKGPAADLDGLMQHAAETAFAAYDPVNWVIYLASAGRNQEALSAAQSYALRSSGAGGSRAQRADHYALWADVEPDQRRALAHALIAIDLDPREMVGWMEAANASAALGHDSDAVVFRRRMLRTRVEDQPRRQRAGYANVMRRARIGIDAATGDAAALEGDYAAARLSILDHYASGASAAALAHDEALARRRLGLALAAGPSDRDVLLARWYVASAARDWPSAVLAAKALTDRAEASKAAPGADWPGLIELRLATLYRPWLALAEGMTGDTASAAALVARSPPDCYLCARVRGQVAAASGDAAGADRGFADAVRQAPDLPQAYLEWGQVLLARGDLAGAERQFALAHEMGPHFADPLKGWGDLLARRAEWRAALAKYDEALKDAPAWADLRAAREAAARRA